MSWASCDCSHDKIFSRFEAFTHKRNSSGVEPIDEDVVFDAAVFIADHGILGLRNGEFADIVGGDSLEERGSAGSGDSHPPHMAHIEEPDMGTDGMVLVHDTTVLDGHLPSGEIDEFGAAGTMLLDEGSLLHYGRADICVGSIIGH